MLLGKTVPAEDLTPCPRTPLHPLGALWVERRSGGCPAGIGRAAGATRAPGLAAPDDRDPYAVSHLGWGLNPQSLWYGIALNGDEPERSRAAARTFPGNFLFSTGPNTQGGGTRKTRGHYDVPMRDCTMMLDNKVIIEKGRIVDENMVVERERRI